MEGNSLSIVPVQDYYGSIQVNISVTDDEFLDSTSFTLEITPVNDSPVLESILDQSIDENQISVVEFNAYDVDNEILDFDYYILTGYGNAEINDNSITITPNQNWFGEIIVDFIVSDGEYYAQDQFIVQVTL